MTAKKTTSKENLPDVTTISTKDTSTQDVLDKKSEGFIISPDEISNEGSFWEKRSARLWILIFVISLEIALVAGFVIFMIAGN